MQCSPVGRVFVFHLIQYYSLFSALLLVECLCFISFNFAIFSAHLLVVCLSFIPFDIEFFSALLLFVSLVNFVSGLILHGVTVFIVRLSVNVFHLNGRDSSQYV